MRLSFRGARYIVVGALMYTCGARSVDAQTQYYNLDGGRPGRVEDAEATARYSLGIDIGPFELEHLVGGTNRYRAEPKLSYGILPFTELEVRVPIVRVAPPQAVGARSVTGVASVAVGALHAFNLETRAWPAFAVGGEVALPAGSLSGPNASYLLKGLVTKTTDLARLHVNVGIGTYSVRSISASSGSGVCSGASTVSFVVPGQQTCATGPPIIIDAPCSIATPNPMARPVNLMCMARPSSPTAVAASPTHGPHRFVGVGLDHAFPLQSSLLTADLVAERYAGLYTRSDWTAESGVRHQLTPTFMLHAGAGWHFAGVVRSASVVFGATYELPTRSSPAIPRAEPESP